MSDVYSLSNFSLIVQTVLKWHPFEVEVKSVKRRRVRCNFFREDGNIRGYGVSTDKGIEGWGVSRRARAKKSPARREKSEVVNS
jgi:hypothetical protein